MEYLSCSEKLPRVETDHLCKDLLLLIHHLLNRKDLVILVVENEHRYHDSSNLVPIGSAFRLAVFRMSG
jgi:hypothetical protein